MSKRRKDIDTLSHFLAFAFEMKNCKRKEKLLMNWKPTTSLLYTIFMIDNPNVAFHSTAGWRRCFNIEYCPYVYIEFYWVISFIRNSLTNNVWNNRQGYFIMMYSTWRLPGGTSPDSLQNHPWNLSMHELITVQFCLIKS